MIDERMRIEYWPMRPSATVDERQDEVAQEVERAGSTTPS